MNIERGSIPYYWSRTYAGWNHTKIIFERRWLFGPCFATLMATVIAAAFVDSGTNARWVMLFTSVSNLAFMVFVISRILRPSPEIHNAFVQVGDLEIRPNPKADQDNICRELSELMHQIIKERKQLMGSDIATSSMARARKLTDLEKHFDELLKITHNLELTPKEVTRSSITEGIAKLPAEVRI